MKKQVLNFNNKQYQLKLRSQADKSVMKEIFELREYKDIEPMVKSAKYLIIDAGAQAGFFSLYCRALNPEVKILAVEPDEDNLEVLQDNLEINKIENVEIVPAALSGQSGLRDFYISTDTHNHSLFKVLTPQINKTGKVKTYSLDDFLQQQGVEKASLLKMDIEGAEFEVLNNFINWQKINNMVLEYHDFEEFKHAQLENLLQKNGYKIKIVPSKFDKKLGFIFATKQKAPLSFRTYLRNP